jgi:hypothetical protein
MNGPEVLERLFPNLATSGYRITSPPDKKYNCIAWGLGDTSEWWWPDPEGEYYWPSGVPREVTIEAFTLLLTTFGFSPCESADHEEGIEKVALYAKEGIPTHIAQQLESGFWTSKLGRGEDIEHTLPGLEGAVYGQVALIARRDVPPDAASPD